MFRSNDSRPFAETTINFLCENVSGVRSISAIHEPVKAPFISVRFSHSLVRLYTAHDINRTLYYATGKVESCTIKARKETRSLPLPAQINRCVYIEEDEGSSHETFTRESRGASLIELFARRRKQRR